MVFNSVNYFIFFTTFFFLYWFILNKSLKYQNLLLLFASYFFYTRVDWRFLVLLISVSILNFSLGIILERTKKFKKIFLYIGLLQGLGFLIFFKYFNFFVTTFNDIFILFGIKFNLQTLNIIIPLGISFFTFRTLSYVIDVYNKKIIATKDWVVFFNYVSFFPSILSGPIDKSKLFIPQLEKNRSFDYKLALDGISQILWGLFKKVVIADNCIIYTNQIFDNFKSFSGSTLILGSFLYTIQIYADFSGYSDMAIGFSRLLGFNITKNFNFPFFSQNISEFWRKWHISLTTWLTEYVFTPLSIALRDYGNFGLILSIIINFTLIGIWHGANWTYILFGFLHGCYFIPIILNGTINKKKEIVKNRIFPSIGELINMTLTFLLVMFTFIIFRSNNLDDAFSYFNKMVIGLTNHSNYIQTYYFLNNNVGYPFLFIISIFFIAEWIQRDKAHGLQFINEKNHKLKQIIIYYIVILTIIFFGSTAENEFIYFKF